jgi:hypothetical protein
MFLLNPNTLFSLFGVNSKDKELVHKSYANESNFTVTDPSAFRCCSEVTGTSFLFTHVQA